MGLDKQFKPPDGHSPARDLAIRSSRFL